jgi:hypothetical protein
MDTFFSSGGLMFKKIMTIIGCAAVLAAVLPLSLQQASAASDISIVVNNETADTDVASYIKNDTVIVPLSVVQKLPNVSITWDNGTKMVTIQNQAQKVALVPGQQTVMVGDKKISLATPVSLEKGRVMVPLRFISETSGAFVEWVPSKRTVYVAKASADLKARLASPQLAVARAAAIDLPRIEGLKPFAVSSRYEDDLTDYYYFVEGESGKFFVRVADFIRYYEVEGQRSVLKWTAKLDLENSSQPAVLTFLPFAAIQQDGKLPAINGKIAYFQYDYLKASTTYGMIDGKGQATVSGQKRSSGIQIYEINGEAPATS